MSQPSKAKRPVKFGRQAVSRPPFAINDLTFSSLPLSLAEEKELAGAGAVAGDGVIDALLEVLGKILNTRASEDNTVSLTWLLDNLTPSDLEGIVEHLRLPESEPKAESAS
ncbi:hypothetical protein EHF33_08990 [Deinococcus psychrotolerans]|uniref:Uncharacterized protein n=1 Tax=Deinococcus psychrotolerans TaxID=2489213 RepID=A0A3G8YC41_9DEIO|nr:hypothetical protein [Deinococcus psychrotolerans]AZI42868.1 hypothetical protein EHF33_08990 [Deinococcus psychrotolerans]